ncbi:hypothetical protein KAR48_06985 [bacterium]|nr:hypothetical protein [bacterium]
MRELYAQEAIQYIPRLLQLVDRNPYSRTHGSFDRSYWHYRTMDFACGMYQEFVLPLAMVYANEYPGNRYYQVERIRELVIAGIRFAGTSSYKDGSCDDYFPFERAQGAMIFSLYACTEAYQLLGLDDEEMKAFFCRRADYLGKKNESGQLANHQAFAALALYNVYLVTGDEKYKKYSDERIQLAMEWQYDEGWFQEYEGADPGYHACLIDFTAKLFQKSGNKALIEPMKKAIDFAWHFMHPDGSYGGEYGSRNTYHFLPHGFEIFAPYSEKAGQIADHFLHSMKNGKRYFNDDDRMVGHYLYNWLQAYDDFHSQRPESITKRKPFFKWFPQACMIVTKTDHYYAVTNMAKGGVIKVFNKEDCVDSDTGLIGQFVDGTVAVSHMMDDQHIHKIDETGRVATVSGSFSKRKHKLATPLTQILFRLILITVGRFSPNLLRSLLQKILITGKSRLPLKFERKISFEPEQIVIEDTISGSIDTLRRISVGSDATSIYVANSNVYQESVLLPWKHATEVQLKDMKQGLPWKRIIKP